MSMTYINGERYVLKLHYVGLLEYDSVTVATGPVVWLPETLDIADMIQSGVRRLALFAL